MELERIREELIAPSSPTPTHLKTYKFSFIDQFFPPIYTPFLLFYSPPNLPNISTVLKQSLSETPSLFYPLAGILKDAFSVDCNDRGVHYIDARVTGISLPGFLKQPDLKTLRKLLPETPSMYEGGSPGACVAMVQETCFPCGGLAFGLQVLHTAMDGVSMASFLKTWAHICAGKGNFSTGPFVNGSSLFPALTDFPKSEMQASLMSLLKVGRFGARRFAFGAEAVERLKARSASPTVGNPTRVEAVSALLCRRLKAARKAKNIAVSYAVNFRGRVDPPVPDFSMGNYAWFTKMKTDETELTGLVSRLRGAFRGVDRELVEKMKDFSRQVLEADIEKLKEMSGGDGTEFIACTSWVNFGVYGVDFGWGKPVWLNCVSPVDSGDSEVPFTSLISLIDAKTGRGIEAIVQSMEEDLCVFDEDEELLSYASMNPDPLTLIDLSVRDNHTSYMCLFNESNGYRVAT